MYTVRPEDNEEEKMTEQTIKPEDIEQRKISDIKPYENNPKEHPQEQIDKIAASIDEFGYVQPIVTDGEGVVIIGHGRLKALQQMGWDEVPVIERDDLTEEQAKALRLADNRIQDDTANDIEALGVELEELADMDFDLSKTGFNEDELRAFDSNVGENPNDPQEEWEDMPEFEAADKTADQTVKVHLRNEADRKAFAEAVNQEITSKTKSIWYPEAEEDEVKDLRWEEETTNGFTAEKEHTPRARC